MILNFLCDFGFGVLGVAVGPRVITTAKAIAHRLSPEGRIQALEAKLAQLKSAAEIEAIKVETAVVAEAAKV